MTRMPKLFCESAPSFLRAHGPINDYHLAPDRVDIWRYSLSENWPNAQRLLNESEQLRANRYHFERHQRRFTQARATLRLILARYLNCQPQSLDFAENSHGKPYLKSPLQIEFNLSHSADLALLAIGQVHPLGIDCEYFSSRQISGISRMTFSEAEIKGFDTLDSRLRSLSFFQIWAQKEALIKACGMGLAYPLQAFGVPHLPFKSFELQDPLHLKNWILQSFMPEPGCAAALCHHPSVTRFRYQTLEQVRDDFT